MELDMENGHHLQASLQAHARRTTFSVRSLSLTYDTLRSLYTIGKLDQLNLRKIQGTTMATQGLDERKKQRTTKRKIVAYILALVCNRRVMNLYAFVFAFRATFEAGISLNLLNLLLCPFCLCSIGMGTLSPILYRAKDVVYQTKNYQIRL